MTIYVLDVRGVSHERYEIEADDKDEAISLFESGLIDPVLSEVESAEVESIDVMTDTRGRLL